MKPMSVASVMISKQQITENSSANVGHLTGKAPAELTAYKPPVPSWTVCLSYAVCRIVFLIQSRADFRFILGEPEL